MNFLVEFRKRKATSAKAKIVSQSSTTLVTMKSTTTKSTTATKVEEKKVRLDQSINKPRSFPQGPTEGNHDNTISIRRRPLHPQEYLQNKQQHMYQHPRPHQPGLEQYHQRPMYQGDQNPQRFQKPLMPQGRAQRFQPSRYIIFANDFGDDVSELGADGNWECEAQPVAVNDVVDVKRNTIPTNPVSMNVGVLDSSIRRSPAPTVHGVSQKKASVATEVNKLQQVVAGTGKFQSELNATPTHNRQGGPPRIIRFSSKKNVFDNDDDLSDIEDLQLKVEEMDRKAVPNENKFKNADLTAINEVNIDQKEKNETRGVHKLKYEKMMKLPRKDSETTAAKVSRARPVPDSPYETTSEPFDVLFGELEAAINRQRDSTGPFRSKGNGDQDDFSFGALSDYTPLTFGDELLDFQPKRHPRMQRFQK